MAVFVANLGGLGTGPSSISPPRTAHSIISVMMSARAGGPRNTHQQKDYPSSYHHFPPSLPPPPPLPASSPLSFLPFSLARFALPRSPPTRSRPIYRPTRANGQNDLRAKNKLPENPPLTELCILYIVSRVTPVDRRTVFSFLFFFFFFFSCALLGSSAGIRFRASKATLCVSKRTWIQKWRGRAIINWAYADLARSMCIYQEDIKVGGIGKTRPKSNFMFFDRDVLM